MLTNSNNYIYRNIIFLFCSILLIFSSCQYDFSDDFYNEIENKNTEIEITFQNFTDNMNIDVPISVNYLINNNKAHKSNEINIYINQQLISSGYRKSGKFAINPYELGEGEYTLRLEYIYISNTNTLADKIGNQTYVTNTELNFKVVKLNSVKIRVKSAELFEGSVKVSWDTNFAKHIESGILYISTEFSLLEEVNLNLGQLLKGEYIDTKSTNEILKYEICSDKDAGRVYNDELRFECKTPSIKTEIVDYDNIKVTIGKHPLFANFDYYIFEHFYNENKISSTGGVAIINTSPHIIEPTYRLDEMSLFKAKNNSLNGRSNRLILNYFIGERYTHLNKSDYIYSPIINKYLAAELIGENTAEKTLYIHSLSSNLSIAKSKFIANTNSEKLSISIDPQSKNYIVDLDKETYLLDNSTLEIIKRTIISDFTTEEIESECFYRNNSFIVKDKTNNKIQIFNSDTKEKIEEIPYNYNFDISETGNHFNIDNNVYELENNVCTIIYTHENRIRKATYIDNENLMFYLDDSYIVKKYNLETKQNENLDYITGKNLSYDGISNTILIREGYNLYIHTPFSTHETTLKYTPVNFSYKPLIYTNGRLILQSGLYVDNITKIL